MHAFSHTMHFFKADIGDSVYTKISSLKQHHDAVKTCVTWMRQHAFCKILLFNVRNSLFMLLIFVGRVINVEIFKVETQT